MSFRFVRKQAYTLSMAAMKRSGKRASIGVTICAALGVSAFAQAQLDFLDPLDQERGRIEKTVADPAATPAPAEKPARPGASPDEEKAADLLSRARDTATSGAASAQERAGGLWSRMRAALGEVAESLGLPTAGLLGLLGLMLAGLACLVGWTLFRGRGDRVTMPDSDIYQRDGKGRGRRRLGDNNPLGAPPSASTDDSFEETMPEDFETIFKDEAVQASRAAVPPKPTDSATWRKPNLDKLRESIKADWKAEKTDRAALAGAGAGAAAAVAAPRSTDPAERSLDEISDGWEAWDTQVKPEDDPWGETLVMGDEDGDDAALRRIRALRESLKAS